MKKNISLPLFCLFFLYPFASAHAQGNAPEMFGVREIILESVRLDDKKASDSCGLSRDDIYASLQSAVKAANLPAIPVAEARPPSLGVARIQLIPEVYTYANESLDCISWVSLTAENRVTAIIPPIPTLRTVTIVYSRQHTRVVTGQAVHQQNISDTLQKMVTEFSRQYHIDQPPESLK